MRREESSTKERVVVNAAPVFERDTVAKGRANRAVILGSPVTVGNEVES